MYIKISDIKIGNRIRELNDDKVKELMESIRLIGLQNFIVLTSDKKLISGHHRLEACKRLGHEDIPCTVRGNLSDEEIELAEIDENFIRNDLTVLEKSMYFLQRHNVIGRINKIAGLSGQNGVKTNCNSFLGVKECPDEVMVRENSKHYDIVKNRGLRAEEQYIQIAKNIPENIRQIIKDTELANQKNELLELSRMNRNIQKRTALRIKNGKAKNIRQARRDIEDEDRRKKLVTPEDLTAIGKFDVIYADPPYTYDIKLSHSRDIKHKYPVMSLEDIKSLRIPAADEAVLFLWVPSGLNLEGLEVMKAWGFEFRSEFIWVKGKIGMGYWLRAQHEKLYIGTKGNFPRPPAEKLKSSVYTGIKGERSVEHSSKPDYFYKVIESYFPGRRYLELFARKQRPGWKAWGNEVKS